MPLVRPRLTDYHGIPLSQENASFAIPHIDEDIPLSLDPFLLWKSPSQQDNALHTGLVNSFNHLGFLMKQGKATEAEDILIQLSECSEVGLGFSNNRTGKRIGRDTAADILSMFQRIPQVSTGGFAHFEVIQLLIDGVSKDRVSDIACNLTLSFLIDFTIDQCMKLGIPLVDVTLPFLYNYKTNSLDLNYKVKLPVSPNNNDPIVLLPKRWLRAIPWLSYEDYITNYYLKEVIKPGDPYDRVEVLGYNRENYDCVIAYTAQKEGFSTYCKNDPIFTQLPITSVVKRAKKLATLPTGLEDNNDQKYEQIMGAILPTMLYPQLDFAKEQSRTESGVLIRDLVFYNTQSTPFLRDIHTDYGSQQIVFEMKNVKKIDRDHINQLNRYMTDTLGKFGILVTRNPLPDAAFKNTIDLWSGQRRCIIALDDSDVNMMVEVFNTKQRDPIEVIIKKMYEFRGKCPS